MAYADYTFYTEQFYGDTLSETNAAKWLEAASDRLDVITFGRLTFAYPTVEAHALKVQKAACAIAEALFNVDEIHKAAAAQKTADGSYRGAVASVSSGSESISYSLGNTAASSYAAAAASESECSRLVSEIAAGYLANIPDANGINLLYAGVR